MRFALMLMAGCAAGQVADTAQPGVLACEGTWEMVTMLCDGEDIGPERALSTTERLTVALDGSSGVCVATWSHDATWEDCEAQPEVWTVDRDGIAHEAGVSVCDGDPYCLDAGPDWCETRPELDATLYVEGGVLMVEGRGNSINHLAQECQIDTLVTLVMESHA